MKRWLAAAIVAWICLSCTARRPPQNPRKLQAAREAAEFFLLRRTGSTTGEIPWDRFQAAVARAERMPQYSLARGRRESQVGKSKALETSDLGSWTSLGPNNIAGRTRVLLIHPAQPERMYAASTTGGIFRTLDGGRNWEPVADFLASLGIGAMAFDPSNPDILYAGTGFWYNSISQSNVHGSAPRGAGIYRSADGGVNWTLLPAPEGNHFRFINQVVVSPRDSNRLYAATWTGIWTSSDGGSTWASSLEPRGSTSGCQSLVLRPGAQTDYLFAACGFYANEPAVGIYRNVDAANPSASWQLVHQPAGMSNTSLAIAPSNPSVIYALSASNDTSKPNFLNGLLGVYRSSSDGDPGSWETRVNNENRTPINTSLLSNNQGYFRDVCFGLQRQYSNQGWIHNTIAVDPLDAERVFVGGIDIYRSDNGGASWGLASFWQAADGPQGAHADLLSFTFPPEYDGGANQTLYAVTDGGVYRTRNARAPVAAGTRGGCPPYQNQVVWEPLHNGHISTQFYSGAVYPGGAAFLGGTQDNGTLLGTSAKPAWEKMFGGDGTTLGVDPTDANLIYVSTPGFSLARSVNAGKTFDSGVRGISDGFLFLPPLAMDPVNPARMYTGGRTLWRTVDRAQVWAAASAPLQTQQGRVSAIGISAVDPNRIIYGTESGFLFRNARAKETVGDSLPDFSTRPRSGYVSGIAWDPVDPNIVYAVYSTYKTSASDHHVYRSTDAGFTWRGIDGDELTGLPGIPVLSILVDPMNRDRILLGTDLGVFLSLDAGATWLRDRNPFANVVTEKLVLNRDAGVMSLYAFTYGRGVWRTILPDAGNSPCSYSSSALPEIPAVGGEATITVAAEDRCWWSVIPQTAAVDVVSPASGHGTSQVRLRFGPNPLAAERTVGVWLQGAGLETRQLGIYRPDALN